MVIMEYHNVSLTEETGFRITSLPHMLVFGLWVKTGTPGVNIQQTQGKHVCALPRYTRSTEF